jgi:hypothetical protein
MCTKEIQNELDVAKATLAFEAQIPHWTELANSVNTLPVIINIEILFILFSYNQILTF